MKRFSGFLTLYLLIFNAILIGLLGIAFALLFIGAVALIGGVDKAHKRIHAR